MDERTLFLSALEKTDPAERSAWLREACGSDEALRQRVEALLRTHDDADSFLEHPPENCIGPTAIPDHSAPEPISLDFLTPSSVSGCLGTLDHYEILEVVGRGGMGVVLKARDSKLHRIVAIKVLAQEFAANITARKRFLREAQAAAAVAHVHVVTIHAIDEQRPYLVMEYIEGQSLKDKIDRTGPLELKEILRIGSQIAAGLAAAHKQGLIHRDIKPANILLENGVQRVKITDFGLARAVDDVAITRTGEVAGTPQYMSPEQAQGHIVDHRSDLFSLGSVLYTMCTGRSPFRADTTIAVIRRVCDDTPRPIREMNADVPGWLCDIIDKLLQKRPVDRFQNAQEVSDLLAQHLAHVQQPSQVVQPAPLPRKAPVIKDEALKSLRGPARGLIWTASINWIGMIVLLFIGIAVLTETPGQFGLGAAEIIVLPVLVLGSSVILWGGLRMLHGESYRLCLIASILAMLIGPGYFIGWPVGIWSLIVLSRPEVREQFRRRKTALAAQAAATFGSGKSYDPPETTPQPRNSWARALAIAAVGLVFVWGSFYVAHDLADLPLPGFVIALTFMAISGGCFFAAWQFPQEKMLQSGLEWIGGLTLLIGLGLILGIGGGDRVTLTAKFAPSVAGSVSSNLNTHAPIVAFQPVDLRTWGEFVNPRQDCAIVRTESFVDLKVPGNRSHTLLPGLNTDAPRILRPVTGDFVLQVAIRPFGTPTVNTGFRDGVSYWGAGLVLWQDGQTLFRFERGVWAEQNNARPYLHGEGYLAGRRTVDEIELLPDAKAVTFLHIERRETDLYLRWSPDGLSWNNWRTISRCPLDSQLQVGIAAVNSTREPFEVRMERLQFHAADAPGSAAQ